jgi:hypothetical protein
MRVRITFTTCPTVDQIHEDVTIVPRVDEYVQTHMHGGMIVKQVLFIYQNDEVILYV